MTVKERLKQRQEALKAKRATDSASAAGSDANSSGSVDDVQPFESP